MVNCGISKGAVTGAIWSGILSAPTSAMVGIAASDSNAVLSDGLEHETAREAGKRIQIHLSKDKAVAADPEFVKFLDIINL